MRADPANEHEWREWDGKRKLVTWDILPPPDRISNKFDMLNISLGKKSVLKSYNEPGSGISSKKTCDTSCVGSKQTVVAGKEEHKKIEDIKEIQDIKLIKEEVSIEEKEEEIIEENEEESIEEKGKKKKKSLSMKLKEWWKLKMKKRAQEKSLYNKIKSWDYKKDLGSDWTEEEKEEDEEEEKEEKEEKEAKEEKEKKLEKGSNQNEDRDGREEKEALSWYEIINANSGNSKIKYKMFPADNDGHDRNRILNYIITDGESTDYKNMEDIERKAIQCDEFENFKPPQYPLEKIFNLKVTEYTGTLNDKGEINFKGLKMIYETSNLMWRWKEKPKKISLISVKSKDKCWIGFIIPEIEKEMILKMGSIYRKLVSCIRNSRERDCYACRACQWWWDINSDYDGIEYKMMDDYDSDASAWTEEMYEGDEDYEEKKRI